MGGGRGAERAEPPSSRSPLFSEKTNKHPDLLCGRTATQEKGRVPPAAVILAEALVFSSGQHSPPRPAWEFLEMSEREAGKPPSPPSRGRGRRRDGRVPSSRLGPRRGGGRAPKTAKQRARPRSPPVRTDSPARVPVSGSHGRALRSRKAAYGVPFTPPEGDPGPDNLRTGACKARRQPALSDTMPPGQTALSLVPWGPSMAQTGRERPGPPQSPAVFAPRNRHPAPRRGSWGLSRGPI